MRRVVLALLFAVGWWAAVLTPAPVTAQNVVGFGVNAFIEDSSLHGTQQVSVQERDESAEYRSDGFLTGSVWFLFQFSERLRFGSMLEYYGTYAGLEKCQDGQCQNPDFTPDRYEFGRQLEFLGRFEYLVPASDRADIILGGVFGAPILFPGGDLRDEIRSLKEQGASVLDVPRIGYAVGPNLGARWRYNDYLSLRSDLFVKWEQLFLFRTVQQIDGIPFRKKWTTGTLRYELGFGVEVVL